MEVPEVTLLQDTLKTQLKRKRDGKLQRHFAWTEYARKSILALRPPKTYGVFITSKSLNVRAEPNPNAKVLQRLKYGQYVNVINQQDNWLLVGKQPDGTEKWVSKEHVSRKRPEQTSKTNNQARTSLTDVQCGILRIEKLSVKTKKQYDIIERQLTRGGCNSEREALRKQWD